MHLNRGEDLIVIMLSIQIGERDNFLKAIVSIIGRDDPPKNIGLRMIMLH